MPMRLAAATPVLLALLTACQVPAGIPLVRATHDVAFPEGFTVVDLTRPLDKDAPFVPHPESFPFERVEFQRPREHGWRTGGFTSLEHMGTHVAAPLARFPVGASVDTIPAAQLVLPLAILDAPKSGDVVTTADVLAGERAHGPIPPCAIVVLRTNRGAGRGSDPAAPARQADRTTSFSFPGWGEEAVRFLALERRARALGTDALAVDAGRNVVDAPAESAGSAAGLWFVVNLADLSHVPARGATLVVGVAPVVGAAGAPARVLALVPSGANP